MKDINFLVDVDRGKYFFRYLLTYELELSMAVAFVISLETVNLIWWSGHVVLIETIPVRTQKFDFIAFHFFKAHPSALKISP